MYVQEKCLSYIGSACNNNNNNDNNNDYIIAIVIIIIIISHFPELPEVESTDDEEDDAGSLANLVEDNPTAMGIYAPLGDSIVDNTLA